MVLLVCYVVSKETNLFWKFRQHIPGDMLHVLPDVPSFEGLAGVRVTFQKTRLVKHP